MDDATRTPAATPHPAGGPHTEDPALEARLWSVLDTAVLLAEETTSDGVLQGLVSAAARLTGARYAALGVLGPDGRHLARFVTSGIDDTVRREIGEEPIGRGILGRLITERSPLRLADISADPRSAGFPPGHPAMSTFLGVPIAVAGEPFGSLYLTDKRDGAPFTEEDEAIIISLGRLAAVAVVNQRLIASARAWAAQLEALREVSDSVVAGVGTNELHDLIVHSFRALIGAEGAALGLFDPQGEYRIVSAEGKGAGFMLAESPVLPRRVIRTLSAGECVRIDSAMDDPECDPRAAHQTGVGPCLLAPLLVDGDLIGMVAGADKTGGGRFSDSDQRLAGVFVQRAAIALTLSERFTRSSVQALVHAQESERRRLGRELHDQTGQELTAALLALRRVGTLVGDNEEAVREIAALRELISGTMVGVRRLSAMLAPPAFEEGGLLDALETLAMALEERTGLTIRIESDGTEVPEDLAATLYRVAQESLTNAVRHAEATTVTVRISSEEAKMVNLSVSDDGTGLDPATVFGVGLSGMRERARLARGTMSVGRSPEGGAMVTVQLPLR